MIILFKLIIGIIVPIVIVAVLIKLFFKFLEVIIKVSIAYIIAILILLAGFRYIIADAKKNPAEYPPYGIGSCSNPNVSLKKRITPIRKNVTTRLKKFRIVSESNR